MFRQGFGRFVRKFHPVLRFRVAFGHCQDHLCRLLLDAFNHPCNFFRRRGCAFGKLPDFVGNHREPPALFDGPGGFDRGIQRQQVGLVGYVVDHLDYLAYRCA